MSSYQYPISTGQADKRRLEILDSMYNPVARNFLLAQGLAKGMTILEYGCGVGCMTCWIAETVGPEGKVVALDSSEAQLEICRERAKSKNLNNIEFVCLDVREVDQLAQYQFDIAYGKWVISFLSEQDKAIACEKLISILKPSGRLVYETFTHADRGGFSYPEHPGYQKWFECSGELFELLNLDKNMGAGLMRYFQQLGLNNINSQLNQVLMKTPEQKSVLRLGAMTTKPSMLKILNTSSIEQAEQDYANYLSLLESFEQSESIGAMYRNILVSGQLSSAR